MPNQEEGHESAGAQSSAPAEQRIERHLADLHEDYIRHEQNACAEVQKLSIKAYREYNETVQNAMFQPDAESQRRVREAYLGYINAVEDLRVQYEQGVAGAFRGYVQGLQRALGQANLSALDPGSLAAISQSAMMIAQCAARLPKESFAAAH
jgi:hypothetical protein